MRTQLLQFFVYFRIAAARRHADKMSKYFQVCDREGIQFFPVVLEALVGWHEDAAALITRLARQLASHTGKYVTLRQESKIIPCAG